MREINLGDGVESEESIYEYCTLLFLNGSGLSGITMARSPC